MIRGFLRGVITTLLLGAVVVAVVIWGGYFPVAATTEDSRLFQGLLAQTREARVQRMADGVEVPALSNPDRIRAGAADYAAMCAGCHGRPNQPSTAMAQGMNPPPPKLSETFAEHGAAYTHWVTRHGIRMTGMPAWGVSHDRGALWPVVAFVARWAEAGDPWAARTLESAASGGGDGHHHDAHTHAPERGKGGAGPRASGSSPATAGTDAAADADAREDTGTRAAPGGANATAPPGAAQQSRQDEALSDAAGQAHQQ